VTETEPGPEDLPEWPPAAADAAPAETSAAEMSPVESPTAELPLVEPPGPAEGPGPAGPAETTEPPGPAEAPEPVAVEIPLALPVPAGPGARIPRTRLQLGIAAVLTAILPVGVVLIALASRDPAVSATFPRPGPVAPATGAAPGTGPGSAATTSDPAAAASSGRPTGSPGAATAPAGATGAATSTPSAVPTRSASTPPGPLTVTYTTAIHIGPDAPGYHATVTISNKGGGPVTGWRLVFELPAGESVTKVGEAKYQQTGTQLILVPMDPNRVLHPGQTITVKFEVTGSTDPPTSCTINGHPCG
jgi:hypothetical protein